MFSEGKQEEVKRVLRDGGRGLVKMATDDIEQGVISQTSSLLWQVHFSILGFFFTFISYSSNTCFICGREKPQKEIGSVQNFMAPANTNYSSPIPILQIHVCAWTSISAHQPRPSQHICRPECKSLKAQSVAAQTQSGTIREEYAMQMLVHGNE